MSAVAGAVLLLAAVVGLAAAHTPNASLSCDGGLHVSLVDYESQFTNTVAISIDGSPISGSPFTFGSNFVHSYSLGDPTKPHTATVDVHAGDDPTGSEGWSVSYELRAAACAEPTPTPTPTPTLTATPTPDPTATPDPTEKPTGEVDAATGRPRTTLPPTATADGSDDGGTLSGLPTVLIALLGIAVAIGLLSPSSNRFRRRSGRQ